LHSAVQVTERGAPEGDVDVVLPLEPPPSSAAPLPAPSEPRATVAAEGGAAAPATDGASTRMVSDSASGEGQDAFDQALQIYRARGYIEAQRLFERLSRSGHPRAAEAAFYEALSTRNIKGCAAALPAFARVSERFPSSPAAHDAAWRAARCQEQLGETQNARQGYEALLRVPTHARRAQQALASLTSEHAPEGAAAP
jgi:TolA-binding protein